MLFPDIRIKSCHRVSTIDSMDSRITSHVKIFAQNSDWISGQNSRQNSGLVQNGQNFDENLGRATQTLRAEEYEGGF